MASIRHQSGIYEWDNQNIVHLHRIKMGIFVTFFSFLIVSEKPKAGFKFEEKIARM